MEMGNVQITAIKKCESQERILYKYKGNAPLVNKD